MRIYPKSDVSKDPHVHVLLLEAGGPDAKPDISIPGRLYNLFNTGVDWSYQSKPQVYLNNRRIDLNRGKVLGGTSSINGFSIKSKLVEDGHR